MITVFVADDQEQVRQGIIDRLGHEKDIGVVGSAGPHDDPLTQVSRARPDVVLLSEKVGIDLSRAILAADPRMRGVMWIAFEDHRALQTVVLSGVTGYVLADARGQALADGVRGAMDGSLRIDPRKRAQARADLQHPTTAPRRGPLTPLEADILSRAADGLTDQQIAELLEVPPATVGSRLCSLLTKLDLPRHHP